MIFPVLFFLISQVASEPYAEDTIKECLASSSFGLKYEEDGKEVLYTIEAICKIAADSSELWKDEKKSFGKKRALTEMLQKLDSSGLSKHRSNFLEVFNIL